MWLALVAAVCGVGTTAGDYYNRALHAETPEQRVELLDRALKINPNHVPSLRERGAAYVRLGKEKVAFADFVRAAELSPEDFELNAAAAALAVRLKDQGQAARFFRQAVAVEPANPGARMNLILALIGLGRADEALPHADYLVEHYPQEVFAYAARVEVLEWLDRYADAVRDATVMIQRRPDEYRYYLQRSSFYRGAGDFRSALADAQRALELQGDNPLVYSALGCCHEGLGELDKALDAFNKAAQLDTERRYYTIWSCLILRKQGKREQAVQAAKEFVSTLKSEEWIGPVLKHLAGQMTEEEVLARAKHDDPETNRQQLCEAYYYLGACALIDGQLDKAEGLFKKTLEQRVNNFYEHGFALRDLKTIEKLRAKGEKKELEERPSKVGGNEEK